MILLDDFTLRIIGDWDGVLRLTQKVAETFLNAGINSSATASSH